MWQCCAYVQWAHATDLYVSATERLFDDGPGGRGDSSEGTQQGFATSSATFSVAIHPELVALDAELRPFGGCARAIMDDIYAAGPPHVVWRAVIRFAAALTQATGLQLQQSKYACYSRGYDLTTCPWRELVGAALGGETTPDGAFTHGVMIGGVPVGDDAYVLEVMRRKADEIVSYIDDTMTELRDHPHAAWASSA